MTRQEFAQQQARYASGAEPRNTESGRGPGLLFMLTEAFGFQECEAQGCEQRAFFTAPRQMCGECFAQFCG